MQNSEYPLTMIRVDENLDRNILIANSLHEEKFLREFGYKTFEEHRIEVGDEID